MQDNPFQTREPNIALNGRIRTPQREAYAALASFAANSDGQEREIGIVLPVGCGKSGCITLTPVAGGSHSIFSTISYVSVPRPARPVAGSNRPTAAEIATS